MEPPGTTQNHDRTRTKIFRTIPEPRCWGKNRKSTTLRKPRGFRRKLQEKKLKKEIYCTLGISGRPITLQSSRVVQLSCVTMFAVLRGLDQSNHLKIGQACRNLWKSVEVWKSVESDCVIMSWGLEEALHSSLQLISQGRLDSGLKLDQGIGSVANLSRPLGTCQIFSIWPTDGVL